MMLLLNIFVLSLALVFIQCNDQKDNDDDLIYLNAFDGKMKSIVVVSRQGEIATGCQYIYNKEIINKVLQEANPANIRTLTKGEMGKFFEACVYLNLKRINENALETTRNENDVESERETTSMFGSAAIFSGTKWCGAGDIAQDFNDLGEEQDVDQCCRAHDFCNDTLLSGESRNNLTNESYYTKLSCACDDEFYSCLERINSKTSNQVGFLYFNVLRNECFEIDYPEICTLTVWPFGTCIKYEKDTSKGKSYQWIRAKTYTKIPSIF